MKWNRLYYLFIYGLLPFTILFIYLFIFKNLKNKFAIEINLPTSPLPFRYLELYIKKCPWVQQDLI